MNKKIGILVFIITCLFVGNAYALGNLAVTVKSDKTTLDLVHGQSSTVTFTITHNNALCSIVCDYGVIDS